MGESRLLREALAVESRNQSEPGQSLESVADSDHQFAGIDELVQFLFQFEFDLVGEHGAGAQVVAEGESSDECENLEGFHRLLSGEKIVDMDQRGFCSGRVESRRRFLFTVQTDSGDDQCFDFVWHSVSAP